MHLTKNEIKIIQLLISSQNYISSYEIATALGIKRSLVRNEMLSVKNTLKKLGYELISKTAKGYMLDSSLSFQSVRDLENIIEQAACQREMLFPSTQGERQIYIFNRLIDCDGYVKIDDLADELLTSRSTITNDLKDARRRLKKYNLSLKQRPNYGLYITGEETSKRRLQCDFLFTNLRQSQMFYEFLNTFLKNNNSLEFNIIEIIKNSQLHFSDIALCDFLICILVTLKRIEDGHTLSCSPDLTLISHYNELKIVKQIVNQIKEFGYSFNEHESNRLAIQLICKQDTLNHKQYSNVTKMIVNHIIENIYQKTLINLQQDSIVEQLNNHIQTSIFRIQYDEKIRTPLYNELKSIYPLGYELASITSDTLMQHLEFSLSLSELSFYTTFYYNIIQEQKSPKKKVLFLSGLGKDSGVSCLYAINQQFANQLEITEIFQYYQLFSMNIKQYDFIISTLPIHDHLDIPHINISQVIHSDDLNKIDNYLTYYKQKIEMLFHPALFETHVNFQTKEDICYQVFQLLKKQFKALKNKSINQLFNLKHSEATFYQDAITLLKFNKPLMNTDIVAVFILEKPLEWEHHSTRIIIILSSSDKNNHLYNTLHSTLSAISQNEDDLTRLTQHPEYVEFIKLLSQYNVSAK